MIESVKYTNCVICENCKNICPKNCINFEKEIESFKYPAVDKNLCINCDLCDSVCPAINIPSSKTLGEFFAVKNKNNKILEKSSSGGIFYTISEQVLKMKGCIIGAAFDDSFNVSHLIVEEIKDLTKLCGSKYVQSSMKSIVNTIKERLYNGQLVLFCGCPCQTAAVKNYVGDRKDNLILIDFICHGIVSPIVFNEYKKYLEKCYKSDIVEFNFRNKKNGWINSGPLVVFGNGKVYSTPLYKDVYMQGYFKNLNVRASCYSCSYKNFKSGSDLTMGDFWGIQRLIPEFYNYMGNSVLVINTHQGKKIWETVKHNFDYLPVEKSYILEENKGLEVPFNGDLNERKKYFKKAKKVGYIKPLKNYMKKPLLKKISNQIKRKLFYCGKFSF